MPHCVNRGQGIKLCLSHIAASTFLETSSPSMRPGQSTLQALASILVWVRLCAAAAARERERIVPDAGLGGMNRTNDGRPFMGWVILGTIHDPLIDSSPAPHSSQPRFSSLEGLK